MCTQLRPGTVLYAHSSVHERRYVHVAPVLAGAMCTQFQPRTERCAHCSVHGRRSVSKSWRYVRETGAMYTQLQLQSTQLHPVVQGELWLKNVKARSYFYPLELIPNPLALKKTYLGGPQSTPQSQGCPILDNKVAAAPIMQYHQPIETEKRQVRSYFYPPGIDTYPAGFAENFSRGSLEYTLGLGLPYPG